MSNTKYTYAVARIRALEAALFNDAVIEQLLACRTYEQCLTLLSEKGWGSSATGKGGSDILFAEEAKIWETIREIAPDIHVFDVLSVPKLYHNLKAAVKEVYTGSTEAAVYYNDCPINDKKMRRIIENKDFSQLPGDMPNAAAKAFDALFQTGDGQLCDIIIDKAALKAIQKAGKASGEKIISGYADTLVAVADIKTAVRAQKTGKSAEFMKNAMVECPGINSERLIQCALAGAEEIASYLETTAYAGGAEALRASASEFECWCDNEITEALRPQKYQSFSVGPLMAYIVAREHEIKNVRMILTGKQNGFSDKIIRERLRSLFV